MKKILLATSILAATTGFAAAEVALTGDARMGVVYDGENVQFSERARVRFNLSGQTDTGLEFGATFRADQAGDDSEDGSKGGNPFGSSDDTKRGTVWISGAFGKLEMGDIVSAAEEAFGDLTSIGFTGLGDYTDIPYINGDASAELDQGPGALYSYSTGAWEFHLGMTDGSSPTNYNADNGPVGVETADRDTTYSVAAAYSAGDYKVGLAYLDNGDAESGAAAGDAQGYGGSQWIIVGEAEFAGVGTKAYYSDFDDMDLDKSYGLTLDYTFGATTVSGFARRDEFVASAAADDEDSFGLGAVYDLGGGASLRGGVIDTDALGDGETIADIGLRLNF